MGVLKKVTGLAKEWMDYNARQRGRKAARPYIQPHPSIRCPRCKSAFVLPETNDVYGCYDCGWNFTEEDIKKARAEAAKATPEKK